MKGGWNISPGGGQLRRGRSSGHARRGGAGSNCLCHNGGTNPVYNGPGYDQSALILLTVVEFVSPDVVGVDFGSEGL